MRLDGEVVALDDRGHPSFQRLQQRARLQRPLDIRRAAVESPATCTPSTSRLRGLRSAPPAARRAEGAARSGWCRRRVRSATSTTSRRRARRSTRRSSGWGSRGSSPRRASRRTRRAAPRSWLKISAARTDDFVVVGFTAPKGSRAGFGALHLAQYVGKRAGVRRAGRQRVRRQAAGRRAEGTRGHDAEDAAVPAARGDPRGRGSGGEEGYARRQKPTAGDYGMTDRRLRVDDLGGAEPRVRGAVHRVDRGGTAAAAGVPAVPGRQEAGGVCRGRMAVATAEPRARRARQAHASHGRERRERRRRNGAEAGRAPSEVPFSNLKKVFWPEDRYTKGDLIEYYRMVAPGCCRTCGIDRWCSPATPTASRESRSSRRMRPTSCPNGCGPSGSGARTRSGRSTTSSATMWSRCSTSSTWGRFRCTCGRSRVAALERPDWCILDLDPKGAPFTDVVKVAHAHPRALRRRSTCRTTSRPPGRAACTC